MSKQIIGLLLFLQCFFNSDTQRIIPLADAWAKKSVNTVVFGRNSLVSYQHTQYIAFYNEQGQVVLRKRRLDLRCRKLRITGKKGNKVTYPNFIVCRMETC